MSAETELSRPLAGHPHDSQLIDIWTYGRSEHTARAYHADAELLRRFLGGRPLASATLEDLQRFSDSLTTVTASRYRTLSAVKSLLAFGHRLGYLPFDVGRALRLPAVRSRLAERILSEADVHRILTLETDLRNRPMLTLLYAAGIRVAELCRLSWRDLRPAGDSGQITVYGKGNKERTIHLPPSVWQLLLSLRPDAPGPNQAVFPSQKGGGHLKPDAVLRIVRAAALRAGIDQPVSPHWFRHAHASHALDRGAPIHLVQATLGHAAITTTGRYLHARPKESSSRFLPL